MLIGRDKFLQSRIYPRLKNKKGFILTGQRGIGKSAILKWAHDNYKAEKMLIDCYDAHGLVCKQIADVLGIETNKKTVAILEKEIIKNIDGLAIFLDDIQRLSPKQIKFFIAINDIAYIYGAGLEPFREELKRVIWGKNKLQVEAIERKYRDELSLKAIKETGTQTPKHQLTQEGRGVAGRVWAIARGEVMQQDDEKVQGEEINIAPLLMLVVACVMMFRYVARGMGEKDLVILGGVAMGAMYIARYFISELRKK
jgi:hypothetical protein